MPDVFKLPGVRLFASGRYRDTDWPPALVAAISSGVRKLGPAGMKLHLPPAVLGHEEPEQQDWLNRTDLEAAGWIDPATVRTEPDPENPGHNVLVGDIVNVPSEVADLIRSGRFRYGSAEVYESFLDDFGRSHGPALRRFAFLGGECPQIKRLGALPQPVRMSAPVAFAERLTCPGGKCRGRSVYLSFVDRVPNPEVMMTPEMMMAALTAALPSLDPEVLKQMFQMLPPELQQQPSANATTPTPPESFAEKAERGRVARFAEKHKADFAKMRRTPAEIVDTFDKENAWRRRNGKPLLTAKQFTGNDCA